MADFYVWVAYVCIAVAMFTMVNGMVNDWTGD